MKRTSLLPAGALAVLAALLTTAAASAATIAPAGAPTAVREYAGTIVFSRFDTSTGQRRLAVRRAGAAQAELLPIAPSNTEFHADIGPDSKGRPELIYQRCGDGRSGCDLFVYSLAGATGERPVRNANDPEHDDVSPTLWRGRIAWTREYGGSGAGADPIVYIKALTAPRSRPSTRLPGVPRRRCGDVERTCAPTARRTVEALELWGENLALTVSYDCADCSGIAQSELRLDDLGDRSARQVAFQVIGLSGQSLIGPSFFAGRLAWYKACFGDPGACQGGAGGPFRYALTSRRYEKGAPGPVRVDGFADSGSRHYTVVGCSEETQGSFNAGCRVQDDPPPSYSATRMPSR